MHVEKLIQLLPFVRQYYAAFVLDALFQRHSISLSCMLVFIISSDGAVQALNPRSGVSGEMLKKYQLSYQKDAQWMVQYCVYNNKQSLLATLVIHRLLVCNYNFAVLSLAKFINSCLPQVKKKIQQICSSLWLKLSKLL